MGVVGRAWARYRARKTRKGIVIDFGVLIVAVVLFVAPIRRGFMTYTLRCVLAQPQPYEALTYAQPADSIAALTTAGADTTLHFPPAGPVVINSADPWSAQSRAEMRSLNIAAGQWPAIRFYVITDADDMADMARYMSRKGYTDLHLLGHRATDSETEISEWDEATERRLVDELLNSIPATILLDSDGQVVVRKFGAARWTGKRIDSIFRKVSDNQNITKP